MRKKSIYVPQASCLLLALLFSVTPAQSAVQSLYKMSEHDAAVAKANAAASTNDLNTAVATLETAIANATPENYPAVASAATNSVQDQAAGDDIQLGSGVGDFFIDQASATLPATTADSLSINGALEKDGSNVPNEVRVAEMIAASGGGNLSSNDVGTMAFEDSADYAGVITNEYIVTAPDTLTRTFNPNTPYVRYIPLSPYLLAGSAAYTQVPNSYTTSGYTPPCMTANNDKVWYPGADMREWHTSGYVLHGYMDPTGAYPGDGIYIKLYPAAVKVDGYSADTAGGYYTICATNGYFSITNTIAGGDFDNAISQNVLVQLNTPNANGVTNLVPVWILGVHAIPIATPTDEVLGTFLIDAGAVQP